MTELQKTLELERLQYEGDIEVRRKALEAKIQQIKRDHFQPGVVESGNTNRLIAEARATYLHDLILTRIQTRKRFAETSRELLLDAELDSLQTQLETTVGVSIQAEHDLYQRESAAAGRPTYRRGEPQIQAEAGELVALIRREISKLKLQRDLGMRSEPESRSIVLNISHSTINAMNLGSIVGDMNATLTTLEQQGNSDLASALKALSEAIASDEKLGDKRGELLENLSLIGDQGKLPALNRKTGIVRAAFEYLAGAVTLSAHATTIWDTWGPQIAAFFRFVK